MWTWCFFAASIFLFGQEAIALQVPAEQRWTPLSGSALDGGVRAAAVDSAGRVWVGGSFTLIGGATSPSVAFYNGTRWQSAGLGFDAPVSALAVRPTDGAVIAAGAFTRSGGITVRGIARWTGSQWIEIAGGIVQQPGSEALSVLDMAFDPATGALYVAGRFLTVSGLSVSGVARYTEQAGWQLLPPAPEFLVIRLEWDVAQGRLIAGGSVFGGSTGLGLATYSGGSWNRVVSPLAGISNVSDIQLGPGRSVYVATGIGASSVHRLDATNTLHSLPISGQLGTLAFDSSSGQLWMCCGHRTGETYSMQLLSWDGSAVSSVGHPDTQPKPGFEPLAVGLGRVLLAYSSEEVIAGSHVSGIGEWSSSRWSILASTRAPKLGRVKWSEALDAAVALGDASILIQRDGRWDSRPLPNSNWTPSAISESSEGIAVAGVTGTGNVFVTRWDGHQWQNSSEAEGITSALDGVEDVIWQPDLRRFVVSGSLCFSDGNGTNSCGMVWAQGDSWGTFGDGLQFGGGPGIGRGLIFDRSGSLWAFGRFDAVDGRTASGMARVEGMALVPALGVPGADISALTTAPDRMIAADLEGRIVSLHPSGGTTLLGAAEGQFRYIGGLVFDDETKTLVASGWFNSVNGVAASNIARFRDGAWRSFRGGVAVGPVLLDWSQRSRILLAGSVGGSTLFGTVSAPGARASINRVPVVAGTSTLPSSAFVGALLSPQALATSDSDGDVVVSSYRWFRNDTPIPGATASTYRVTRADRQQRLKVELEAFDGEDSASVQSLDVSVLNRSPVTTSDRLALDEGEFVELPVSAVLDNDVDLDGDPLEIRVLVPPVGGVWTLDGSGRMRVGGLAAGRYAGRYSACDDLGACADGTLEIAVRPTLAARDDTALASGLRGAVAINVLANDRFVANRLSGGRLTFEPPSHGAVSIQTQGTADPNDDRLVFTWSTTPAADRVSFRYSVCETGGRCSTATVYVTHQIVEESALGSEVQSTGGWIDIDQLAVAELTDVAVEAHGLVAPKRSTLTLVPDETPENPWDAQSVTELFVDASLVDSSMRRRVFVDAQLGALGVIGLEVGIDRNGNRQAEFSERVCNAQNAGSAQRCSFELLVDRGEMPSYWVRTQLVSGAAQAAVVRTFEVPIDLPLSRRTLVATAARRVLSDGSLRIRVVWNDPTFVEGEERGGWLYIAAQGIAPTWQPLRWIKRGSQASAFALQSGVDHRMALAANGSHESLYIDVPPGSTQLQVTTTSASNVNLFLARIDALAASSAVPAVAAAPPRNQALASATTASGNELLTVSSPAAGRWYVTPVNATNATASLTVRATVTGTAPVVRAGGYFNPQRSGNGLFLYPAGADWAGLWYTYLQDGTTTWYYLQGGAPGANGIWRGTIFRSAWNGSSNRLTAVGEATATPTGADAFTYTYTLDGETGSEAYAAFGRGCPNLGGNALNVSGHWFNPARPGTGYSVQLLPNYEFYLVFGYDGRGLPRFLVAERSSIGGASETLNLEQLTGACPLCTRSGNPTRSTIGTFQRTFANGSLGNITLTGTFTAGVPGTWAANDAVTPLGGLQGCGTP